MEQPFVFGVPAEDTYFIGREKESARLESNFKYGVNTVLMSPRRWGKTSLVKRVAGRANINERIIIQMDIFACRSEYDFYNTFSSVILKQTASKVEEWYELAKGFIERLIPKLSVSPEPGAEYSVSLGITPKTHSPQEVLSLPEIIAERKKCELVICIDEFQQVGEFPNSLEVQKRLRGVWQHQKHVSYCLYGSKLHMMTKLFLKKSYPFYKFGEVLNLEPIPLQTWTPYIQGRFKTFGKQIDEVFVKRICETVDYQASYVQQLAYSVLLLSGDDVTEESFGRAVDDLLAQNSNAFIEQTQSLTTYQLNFLRAIMDGVSSGFGEASVRDQYNLGSASNITRLKQSMIDKELVEFTPEGIILGDPVLKLWLKRLFTL
ncbi:MAG: ATP-binding protein [Bacteroidales bacterium]|nr:ATP-binding protein [Bacteroidales bacterium]